MRTRLAVAATVCLAACLGPEFGECLGTAIGQAIGNGLLISAHEKGQAMSRPDEGALGTGGTWVSMGVNGGRLGLLFGGAPRTEALPRLDAGCTVEDLAYFLDSTWPDAGSAWSVKGQVTLVESTPVDGGTHLVMDATGLTRGLADGGWEPLADRHVDVVAR